MAFRVRDVHQADAPVLEPGAQPMDMPTECIELRLPAIRDNGGAPLQRIGRFGDGESIDDIGCRFPTGVERHLAAHGLRTLDHLTHNVYRERVAFWRHSYARIFNVRELRDFDIQGEDTGLRCDDLLSSVERLPTASVPLMVEPSDTSDGMLQERLPGHGEPVQELRSRGFSLDGKPGDGTPRLRLQVFSQPLLRPVFFECVQHEDDEGFGAGDFKTPFASLERDPIRHGSLQTC